MVRQISLTNIRTDGSSNGQVIVSSSGTAAWANAASGGPKITSIVVANSGYSSLDDTAVDLTGGYIKIIGTGFTSGAQVVVDSTPATSTTFVSDTEVRAQLPAKSAGSYNLFLTLTDGSVAIKVSGVTYSSTPTWSTSSTQSFDSDVAINLQLSASSDTAVTYSLQAGSSLPSGLTLAANGLLSGTVSVVNDTVYSFTVEATDVENQNSPRTFNVTINTSDAYFQYVSMLLNGDGDNGAQNNTFADSSTSALSITRTGNPTQGTFSPFVRSDGRWSNYFDGTGDYLSYSTPAAGVRDWWVGDFTCEAWIYPTTLANWSNNGSGIRPALIGNMTPNDDTTYWAFGINGSDGEVRLYYYNGGSVQVGSSLYVTANQWNHIAFTKTSSGIKFFCNGTASSFTAVSGTPQSSSGTPITIGSARGTSIAGYVSNLRVVYGTAVYSGSTYTVPTTPLTAITNTSFLTCQSNRFIDNSTNGYTITRSGDTAIQPFGPFNPTAAYSTSTNGGSGFFDGSGDYIDSASNSVLSLTGQFTVECWYYQRSTTAWSTVFELNQYTDGLLFRARDDSTGGVWVNGTQVVTGGSPALSSIGRWSHFAITRNASNSLSIYLNGSRIYNATVSGTINSAAGYLRVGASQHTGSQFHDGYISDMRVVKGSTVYDPTQSTITIPTAPLTAITNTTFLCSFVNGAIVDRAGINVLETLGNAQVSTSVKKYGTGSIYFDGTGDYLQMPASQNFAFGTGDFTIEFWMNSSDVSTAQRGFFQTSTSAGGFSTGYTTGIIGYQGATVSGGTPSNASGGLAFNVLGSYIGSTTSVVSTGTWYHVALTRASGSVRLFLDGTQIGSTTTVSGSIGSTDMVIGGYYSSSYLYNGYLDDFRITRGYARYTSNFTAPTSAHRLR